MRKLCRTDRLCDQPIFVEHEYMRCGPANSSELAITAPVDDQYFGLKIECMLTRDKHNHDKQC